MNLKNYTSKIPASTTISYIEVYLSECGVSKIAKTYSMSGKPEALMFQIDIGGKNYTVRLPAHFDQAQEAFWREYVAGHKRPKKTKEDFADQAVRTAWKIQHDWVQMSLVKLNKTDFRQVFMGFLWDGEESYFERVARGGFKALAEHSGG